MNRISSQYFSTSEYCTEFLIVQVLGCHETPLSLCRPPVINRSSAPSTPDPFFFNGTFFNKENATDERTFVSYLRVSCAVCTPYDRFLLLMRLLSLPTQKTLIKVIAYYIECYPKVVPESRKNPLLVIVTLSCICIGIRPWKF